MRPAKPHGDRETIHAISTIGHALMLGLAIAGCTWRSMRRASTCRAIAARAGWRRRIRWPPSPARWRSASPRWSSISRVTARRHAGGLARPALNPDLTRDARRPLARRARARPSTALTLAQLKRYDVGRINPVSHYGSTSAGQLPVDGERIPTLAELFALVRRRGKAQVRFNIETKLSPERPERHPGPGRPSRPLLVEPCARPAWPTAPRSNPSTGAPCWSAKKWRRRSQTACLTIDAELEATCAGPPAGASPWLAGLDAGRVWRLPAARWSRPPAAALVAGLRDLTPAQVAGGASAGAQGRALDRQRQRRHGPADRQGVDGLITDYPDRLRRSDGPGAGRICQSADDIILE